jgi:hypothetical protein
MKRCPTEAIRVRSGKAKIDKALCIGCGECVRICKSKAKSAVFDSISTIETSGFKYKIALPSPSLYAQFENIEDIDIILTGLKHIGFDGVFESALGCEIATDATALILKENIIRRPVISSACPAVVKLILFRYEGLANNISLVMRPEEISARLAREEAVKATGLKPDEIGVFFISPCSASVCALKTDTGEKHINYALSQNDIYFKLVNLLPKIEKPEKLSRAGNNGIRWAMIGGEAKATGCKKYLAADGIENVISILDALDHGRLNDVDFIELAACPAGCVGGVLNVENPYIARAKIHGFPGVRRKKCAADICRFISFEPFEPFNLSKLSDDRAEAMKKLVQLNKIHSALPGLDCGACGAPSCRAFAEDVVKGLPDRGECMRKRE